MATSTCLAPPGPSARATGRARMRQNVRAPSGHVRQVLGAEPYFGGSVARPLRHRCHYVCGGSRKQRQAPCCSCCALCCRLRRARCHSCSCFCSCLRIHSRCSCCLCCRCLCRRCSCSHGACRSAVLIPHVYDLRDPPLHTIESCKMYVCIIYDDHQA
jgi:hypothetical protein